MSDNIEKIWISPKNSSGFISIQEFISIGEFKRLHEPNEWTQIPYDFEGEEDLREELEKKIRKIEDYKRSKFE